VKLFPTRKCCFWST